MTKSKQSFIGTFLPLFEDFYMLLMPIGLAINRVKVFRAQII